MFKTKQKREIECLQQKVIDVEEKNNLLHMENMELRNRCRGLENSLVEENEKYENLMAKHCILVKKIGELYSILQGQTGRK